MSAWALRYTCLMNLNNTLSPKIHRGYHSHGLRIAVVALAALELLSQSVFNTPNPSPNDHLTVLGYVAFAGSLPSSAPALF